MSEIERAFEALSTLSGSTGNYLIPQVVDPLIRDYVSKANPLLSVVTRKPWPTNAYFVRRRTALPTAEWAADGGSLPTATRSSYTMDSKAIKYLYTRGEVTGPMIAASGGVVNALQEEIRVHSQIIAEQLTTDIVVGDSGGDPNEIDGMLEQIPATDPPGDYGGTRTESGALTLQMIDRAIDDSRGEADVILTSRAVRRKINSLLQAQQRFVDTDTVGAGFRVLTYDNVPILTDLHWEENNMIIFFRRSDAKLLVNQDFTFLPLARTKDSEDFFIKGYFGFALEGRPVLLTGFTAAT